MKVKIKHWNSQPEADAAEAFLTWQCVRSERENQCPEVLEFTSGRPGCCLVFQFEDPSKPEVVISKFQDLIKYWDEEGLWLI